MKRRDLLVASGALLAVPFSALAQQPTRVWRIGFLVQAIADPETTYADSSAPDMNLVKPDPYSTAFLRAMKEAGHSYGVDYVVKVRSAAGDDERLPELAKELLQLKVDIIVPVSPIAVNAAYKASKTVPIVCIATHDPVGLGMAASLARPGGNLTGVATYYGELIPKHLELLKTILPKASRVAILVPAYMSEDPKLVQKIRAAARKLGTSPQLVPVASVEQLPRAFSDMVGERADALVAAADAITYNGRRQLAELALKHRLPSLFATRENVQAGGLASYGEDFVELFAFAAKYVSRIMKGAKPGDLPIEQPTRYRLVINLATARALKLGIPQELLLRADEVIE